MQSGDIYKDDLWNKVLRKISETGQVNSEVFDLYFNGSKLNTFTKDEALIEVPGFINYTIMNQYRALIEQLLQEITQNYIPVTIVESKNIYTPSAPITLSNPIIDDNLEPDYTFSKFVVGRSNAQAQVAANTVASNPGFVYNPLFIYGTSGIGKTHLLHAIGHEIKEKFPNMKIGLISGDSFVDDVYQASKTKSYDELKQSFKDLDLLLVDDIQFIADKPKTHEIFFNIFNHLVNNKKQICVTSDRSPEEIKGLEQRLITRFNQGLTVNISAPEFETAVNILKMKINNNISISQQIDDEVINYIATNFSQDVRSLEGALTRLLFYSINWSEDKEHITLQLAAEAFKEQIKNNKDVLSFDKVKKVVADYYNISKEQLISKNRTKNIVNARHIAIYLCRKLMDKPYETIGDQFGKRDHATIMNSCERVEEEIKKDSAFKQAIAEIESKLNSNQH